jgi:hypothetical protein
MRLVLLAVGDEELEQVCPREEVELVDRPARARRDVDAALKNDLIAAPTPSRAL